MSSKTVAQKMYIKPGMALGLFNAPENIEKLLGLPKGVKLHKSFTSNLDILLAFIENRKMLEDSLSTLKTQIHGDGALWLAYHKSSSPVETDINRDAIHAYAQTLNLKGVGMVSINSNWSGFRFKKI